MLTLEEFWKLPEDKKADGYMELSDHDKYAVRVTMPIEPAYPKCNDCRHLNRDFSNGLRCRAFPNGIPDEIFCKSGDHTKPYEGDNGIQFEPIEKEWKDG